MICEGTTGRLFEVDSNGNTVWEYVSPIGPAGVVPQGSSPTNPNVFRASRYAANYLGLIGQDLTPQGYIEPGSTFTCTLYSEDICTNNLDINTTLATDTTLVADLQITANNLLQSPATITYHAGECINLEAGFEVVLGAVFEASIEGCP